MKNSTKMVLSAGFAFLVCAGSLFADMLGGGISELGQTYPSKISSLNASAAALATNAVYTGAWEDVSAYPSLTVAVKTDQNGSYSVQYSPDGVNLDSTLTRYYRTTQIEPPHRFTNTRKWARVVFTNGDAAQSYMRLQVTLGDQSELNAPADSVLAKDFDAIAVRPSDYHSEVALGRRQGSSTWNKFGYNGDLDVGTEVVASFGGTYEPLVTGSTIRVVSSSTNDTNGGVGSHGVVIYGMSTNFEQVVEVVFLNGTANVDTTTEWMGVSRMANYRCGTQRENVGTITCTAINDGSTQSQMPPTEGTSQQLIYWVPKEAQALLSNILLKANKTGGGQQPIVTFKLWVLSYVANSKYEVFRYIIDTSVENHLDVVTPEPFIVGEKSAVWIEATSDKVDTEVSGRFSLVEHKDPDSEQ